MQLGRLSSRFGKKPDLSLDIVWGPTAFSVPEFDRRFPFEPDMRQALEELAAAFPEASRFRFHYQDTALTVIRGERKGPSMVRWIQEYLLDGSSPNDYLLSFAPGVVGLLPRQACRELFEFAQEHDLADCRICAFPCFEEDGERVLVCEDGSWLFKNEGDRVLRLFPLPEGAFSRDRWSGIERIDVRGQCFQKPLFYWVDPNQQERLTAKKNRRFLILATVVAVLVLTVVGIGLQIARGIYEERLLNLTDEYAVAREQRQTLDDLNFRFEQTLTEIQTAGAQLGRGLVAGHLRRIANLCPPGTSLSQLRYERDIEGGKRFLLEGESPDREKITDLNQALSKHYAQGQVRLLELSLKQDENQGSNRRGFYQRNQPEQQPQRAYRFVIELEVP